MPIYLLKGREKPKYVKQNLRIIFTKPCCKDSYIPDFNMVNNLFQLFRDKKGLYAMGYPKLF